jgi:hypothetical protein
VLTARHSSSARRVVLAVVALSAALGASAYFLTRAPRPASAERALLDAVRDRPGDPSLGQLFSELNARHFGGQLPNVRVIWAQELDRLDIGDYRLNGMTDGSVILLKTAFRDTDDDADVRRTLCHEMVHVELINAGRKLTTHDAIFQDELRRIFEGGCFQAIPASEDEKAALKAWIDAERARLDTLRSRMDAEGTAIKSETDNVDRLFATLNERIAAANGSGSGWPAREETEAAERQRAALNDRIVVYNSALSAGERDQAQFNEAVQRYNLMLAYPDGLAEDRARGLIR